MYSRALTTLTLMVCVNAVWSQTSTRDHRIQCDQPLNNSGTKYVEQVVHDLDPNGRLALEERKIHVRINAELDGAVLLDALNATAVAVFSWGWPAVEDETGSPDTRSLPIPVNTGNAVQDSMDFAAAKQAWFLANPGAYTLPSPQGDQ